MASLRTRIAWLIVVALGLCAAIAVGMGAVRTADGAREVSSSGAAAAPDALPHASRFLLNALLVAGAPLIVGPDVVVQCR